MNEAKNVVSSAMLRQQQQSSRFTCNRIVFTFIRWNFMNIPSEQSNLEWKLRAKGKSKQRRRKNMKKKAQNKIMLKINKFIAWKIFSFPLLCPRFAESEAHILKKAPRARVENIIK
jgi:hypothetical protein